MLMTTLATALGIGTSLYGLAKSAKENKKGDAITDQTHASTNEYLYRQRAQDYTQRSDFQNALNRQRELLDAQYKREQGVNAVIGGNENALQAQRQASANSLAQTMSTQAAKADAYKDSIDNAIVAENQSYGNKKANSAYQKANTIANATSAMSSTLGQVAAADKNTWGDDRNMFGLDMSNYEWRGEHYVPKVKA